MNEQAGNATTESSGLDGDAENLSAAFQAGQAKEDAKRGKPGKKDTRAIIVLKRGLGKVLGASGVGEKAQQSLAVMEDAYKQTGKNYYSKLLSKAAIKLESEIAAAIRGNAGRPTLEVNFDVVIKQKDVAKRYVPSVQELMDTDGMAEYQKAIGRAQEALLAKGITLDMGIDQKQGTPMSRGLGISGRSSVFYIYGRLTPAPKTAP